MRKISLKTLLCLVVTLTLASNVVAQTTHTTKIALQSGEKWWGVFVSQAPLDPFLRPFRVNTADSPLSGRYVPMMLSSTGRYVWSSQPMEIEFDGKSITIVSEHEKVEVVAAGKNLQQAYMVCCHKNFPPSRNIPDVSMFTMPQYDTSIELGYVQDQGKVLEYAGQILEHGLPAGVLVIADGWRSANDPYAFDRDLYPDPGAMIEELHAKGFKVMLTITPYAQPFGRQYIVDMRKGYFLRDDNNLPITTPTSGGVSVSYDMSSPQQAQMVDSGIKRLKESYRIDGFRFDCRAIIPFLSDDKERASAFMTAWTALGAQQTMCEYLPGLNTPLASYVGDMESRDGLLAAINDVVSAGLTGFPYSHISSLTSDTTMLFADQPLMTRQLQIEAAMPVMKVGFAPWRVTDAVLYEAALDAIKTRADMGDYIRDLVARSALTGEPLLRHMEYEFPKSGFANCNSQFMLGSRYLVVPNTNGDTKLTVRLPRGSWLDRGGKVYKGPRVLQIDCSNKKLVMFELTNGKK